MRRYAWPFLLVAGLSACALEATPARPPLGGSLVLGPAPTPGPAGANGGPGRAAVALPDLPLVPKFPDGKATAEGQILATQGARVKELPAAPAVTRATVALAPDAASLGTFGAPAAGPVERGLGAASPAQRAAHLRAYPTIATESPVLAAPAGAAYRLADASYGLADASYALAALPEAVDMRAELGPVRDQGARATGLFFAVAAAADHLYRGDPIMPIKQASPQFMAWLYQVRLVGQTAPKDLWNEAGASLDLFHLALLAGGHYQAPAVPAEQGYVAEEDCPYPDLFFAGAPAGAATPADMARKYLGEALYARLAAGERVTTQGVDLKPVSQDLVSLRTVLASARCVALTVPVHPADWSPAAPAHRIAELTPAKLTQLGYQAVLLVGYEVDPAAPGGGWFLVRNSWGARWGDAGHARLSFAYVRDFGFGAFAAERYDRPFIATVPLAPSDGKVVSTLPVAPVVTPRPVVVPPKPATPKPATPTPTPAATATPTPKPTAKPTNTPRPSATPTASPTPAPEPTATPTPDPTPTPTPTPSPSATASPTEGPNQG